tara:strand:+ start:1212 stop:1412 length:201 start_codon:yes stop_codon:yes gene_type:complete
MNKSSVSPHKNRNTSKKIGNPSDKTAINSNPTKPQFNNILINKESVYKIFSPDPKINENGSDKLIW